MLRFSNSVFVLALAAIAALGTRALGAPFPGQPGPDVIVSDIPDTHAYGPGVPGIYAYDLGTTSCNKGNNNLRWLGTSPFHPVICQNVYRYRIVNGAGQFEQIGMSWVKHGFYATSQNLCSTCNNQAINGNVLGVGCSDPYDDGLNGTQDSLGPRSEINPATGVFPYIQPHNWPPITGYNSRRLQIDVNDLTGGGNTSSLYFGEAMYVTSDDAAAGNSWNNISWRPLTVNTQAAWLTMSVADVTHQMQPALYAWKVADPTVRLAGFDVPGEVNTRGEGNGGRYWLGHAVTQTGPSTWHYEYCLLNMTSDRAAAGFTIPIAPGTIITNAATRTPASHSGEPYSNAPWTITTTGTSVTFACPEAYADNANASALRWGLTATFRFDASVGPGASDGSIAVALFKPGTPDSFVLGARTPGGASAAAPVPANDECASAQPIHSGENRSCTLGATSSAPAACVSVTNDVWFSYTYHSYDAPGNCLGGAGNITFDTCGSEFDTSLAVYSGTCPPIPGTELNCNDDAGTCSGSPHISSVTVSATEGTTYLIRVGSPAGTGGQRGNLVLNVTTPFCIPPNGACCASNGTCQIVAGLYSCYSGTFIAGSFSCSPNPCPQPPAPANDNCAGAIAIGDVNLGYPALQGTNTSANQTTSESCSGNQGFYDVWYTYTPATTGTVVVDTCSVPSSGVLMDTIVSIHSGSCAGSVVACNDDDPSGLCANTSRISTPLTAGTLYYIRVAGYGATVGDFVLRVAGGGGAGAPQTGACCWGSTCSLAAPADCTGPYRAFSGTGVACNSASNHTTPCCQADFNHTDGLAVQDIFDFLNTWFTGSQSAAFAGDGVRTPTVQDIFDFLNAWFVGCS